MKASFHAGGLLSPAGFARWRVATRREIRNATRDAMREVGPQMVEDARREMRRAFTVRRPAFLQSMRARVYSAKADRLPALLIGSKIDWLGIHASGGTVAGAGKKMLIPLTEEGKRIGRKAFKRTVDRLIATGNAFFLKKNGRVLLMAENIRDNSRELARFKRADRTRSGIRRHQRGAEIPIAVLVPRVRLRRRFDLDGAVRARLPALAAAIERRLNHHA